MSTNEWDVLMSEIEELASSSSDATYVCCECDRIAGYYDRCYRVVPCPHCDADAHAVPRSLLL